MATVTDRIGVNTTVTDLNTAVNGIWCLADWCANYWCRRPGNAVTSKAGVLNVVTDRSGVA